MNMERYLKGLEYLPQIVGIYEDTLKDYVSNHKCHFFWFRWARRFQLEKREKESLDIYFKYLNSLVDDDKSPKSEDTTKDKPKQESNAETKNKLHSFLSNLGSTKKDESKQPTTTETPKQ